MKKRLLLYTALLLLPGAWLGSEWLCAVRIRPTEVHTVSDHLRRFGEPRLVYEVHHDGATFYEFTGFSRGGLPLLALPSSPPAYVYDQRGQFVTWCSDPGDQPSYRQAWPRVGGAPLDMQTVRHRLSL